MATLSPNLSSTITPESPVQAPSGLGALAQLAGGFFRSFEETSAAAQPSYTERKDALETQRTIGLQNGLIAAQQLRAQGKDAEARRLETTVMTNYAREGGDLGSTNTKSVIETVTGRPMDHAGKSPQEIAYNGFRESSEYVDQMLAATYALPEGSQEEREAYAFNLAQQKISYENTITNTNLGWLDGKQQAFSGVITNFTNTYLGALFAAGQAGQAITHEDFKVAQSTWAQQKAAILGSRPSGLEASHWKPIEDQIKNVDDIFSTLEKFSGVEGIQAQTMGNIAKAISQSDQPDWIKSWMLNIMQRDPKVLADMGVVTIEEIRGAIEATIPTGADPDSLAAGDPEAMRAVEDSVTNMGDAGGKFSASQKLSEALRTIDSFDLQSDPTVRNAFFDMTMKGFKAMESISSANGEFVSSQGISKFFSGKLHSGIMTVAKTDPVRAEAMLRAGYDALASQHAVATQAVVNLARGRNLSIGEDGLPVIDQETIMSTGINQENALFLNSIAKRYYSGDFTAMIKDGGQAIRAFQTDDTQRAFRLLQSSSVGTLKATVDDISNRTEVVNLLSNRMETYSDSLGKVTTEFLQGTNPDKDKEDGSSFSFEAARPMLDLIDRTEGGGNYDTLYGHAQKGGKAFAGTRVSQMTIGELKRFSKGEYASYMKNLLGYVATPMGRYQFVGTTLSRVANAMGLPDNTVFTSQVQDAMFMFHAKSTIKGITSMSAKRAALRGQWEGLKHVSDGALNEAIAALENTAVPNLTDLQSRESNMSTTPSATMRPEPRDLTSVIMDENGVPRTSFRPEPRGQIEDSLAVTEELRQGGSGTILPAQAKASSSSVVNAEELDKVRDRLKQEGILTDEAIERILELYVEEREKKNSSD